MTNLTITTAISTRRLQNAATRRAADASRKCNVIMAKAISGADVHKFCAAEDDFKLDRDGRKVRQTKATDAEIAHALRGNRVLDSIEILEVLGEAAFNNLVSNGTLRRDASFSRFRKCNLYWITKKACELYGVPATVVLAGGGSVALVD